MRQYRSPDGRLTPSSINVRSTYRGRRARNQPRPQAFWNAVILRRTHPYADEIISAHKQAKMQNYFNTLQKLQELQHNYGTYQNSLND